MSFIFLYSEAALMIDTRLPREIWRSNPWLAEFERVLQSFHSVNNQRIN